MNVTLSLTGACLAISWMYVGLCCSFMNIHVCYIIVNGRMFMTWMIPDILINVEAHIMGHAWEEAELDWLSVSLLRRMVLVRSQVLSLFTPHININDMLMTWMMPNMLINARHSCMVQTLYESSTFMPHECLSLMNERSCYSYNGHVHVHYPVH